MHVTIMVGAYPVGFGGLTSHVESGRPLSVPHCSAYTRYISVPVQSLMEIGMLGGENFSPNCGENGSNSEVKSSVITPVKWAAAWAEVKTQNFASAACCSC